MGPARQIIRGVFTEEEHRAWDEASAGESGGGDGIDGEDGGLKGGMRGGGEAAVGDG